MQSMILDHHLEDILCDKHPYLLEPMNFIVKARACREKGAEGLDDCLLNLNMGIQMLVSYRIHIFHATPYLAKPL